jgi:hypothetical protein
VKRFMVVCLLLSCTVAFSQKKKQAGASATPSNPWIGNFKLDVAQSKIPGQPPQEEMVAVSAADKTSVNYTIHGKDAQGNSYTVNYEGKPGTASPQLAEGNKVADIKYEMPSSHQFSSQGKGTDGSTSTGTITLSQDNKTITVQEHSKDPKGTEQETTMVYVRQ